MSRFKIALAFFELAPHAHMPGLCTEALRPKVVRRFIFGLAFGIQ